MAFRKRTKIVSMAQWGRRIWIQETYTNLPIKMGNGVLVAGTGTEQRVKLRPEVQSLKKPKVLQDGYRDNDLCEDTCLKIEVCEYCMLVCCYGLLNNHLSLISLGND